MEDIILLSVILWKLECPRDNNLLKDMILHWFTFSDPRRMLNS